MNMFEVSITAVIRDIEHEEKRYLITQRSHIKKRFPDMWTVPGGHLEEQDYKDVPLNGDGCRYGVLENALHREVREEVGLEIKNLRWITSMTLDHDKVLVISLLADYAAGETVLDAAESQDYAWVTLQEAKSYKLIDGIFEELELAEAIR